MVKKRSIILIAIMLAVCVAVPIMAVVRGRSASADTEGTQMTCLTVWQIDGFEGGKGSRAQFLTKTGERCFKNENIYVSVTTLSADMARKNLGEGNLPDMISYSAGFYGLENCINDGLINLTWCNGFYCLLTLDESADFTDVNAQNTVVNEGKDNLTEVAVSLCGLNGATFDMPTNAYLKLISGKYKYLLGTQRDIFRLKTRGESFKIKAVTQFNDLYQNIAVLTNEGGKIQKCQRYINYLTKNGDVSGLGLFNGVQAERTDELEEFAEIEFETRLNCLCSESYIKELKECARSGEINKIKNLLK